MSNALLSHIASFVSKNIGPLFHDRKIAGIKKLNLHVILRRKNPYLFRAKNILSAHELVQSVMDASLSSGEETIFGNFIEELQLKCVGTLFVA